MKKRIVVFCVTVLSLILCGCSKEKEGAAEFEGYSIEIGECNYNSETRTGSVELKLTGQELGLEKLFYTSEDKLNNGFNIIINDEYSLGVFDEDRNLECEAYETGYQDETQTIKIYYVDPENSIDGDKININIIESKNDDTAKCMQGNLKIEDKSVHYLCPNASLKIYMSSTGILIDSGSSSELEPEYRTIAAMNLKTKDKEYMMAIDPVEAVKAANNKELVKAKKYVKEDIVRMYAVDIADWKDIEQIGIGDYIYVNENMSDQISKAGKIETFYTEDLKTLDAFKNGDIKDCYITNKYSASNYFHIDKNHVLWGSGYNHYGQLGINHPEDTNSLEKVYEKDQKIAENVVHVDASDNGYFMLYLTEDGKLYGVGANLQGVLGNEIGEDDELNPWMNVVYTPKLLMDDVAYMRAGMECAIALKTNGDVFWWGEFWDKDMRQPTHTEPHLMVQNAVYAVTGNNYAGAITSDGELYMWGTNLWGQCGAGEDVEFVSKPMNVMDHVRMVWCDEIKFNSSQTEFKTESNEDLWTLRYNNTFVATEDGQYYAAGKNLGNTAVSTGIPWDDDSEMQAAEREVVYSAKFVPIKIREKQ